MRTISTGQPATVGTYYGISRFFGDKAEAFMKEYMDKYGPDEEVMAEESQMLYLLANISQMELDEIDNLKKSFFDDNLFEI